MNLLLTSVGRRAYMVKYFVNALEGKGFVHAANSHDTYAMHAADKSVITPLIHDVEYIDFLLEYSKKNAIQSIISLFDIDLPVLSRHKQIFADAGVQVVVPDYEIIQICNDKWRTFQFLTKIGLKAPKSFISLETAISAFECNQLSFPVIVKPRWGMGSIGIFQADNSLELKVLLKKVRTCIQETYLRYESKDAEHCVIIQEKLEGDEFGLDILNDLQGNFMACVPKRKISMRAGETDSAEIIHSKELNDLGRRISEKTKHVGNLDVDCFKGNGFYYIVEMNCRFGGQYPFSHLAGVDFPKAIIKMLSGETVDDKILIPLPGTVGVKDIVPRQLKQRSIEKDDCSD